MPITDAPGQEPTKSPRNRSKSSVIRPSKSSSGAAGAKPTLLAECISELTAYLKHPDRTNLDRQRVIAETLVKFKLFLHGEDINVGRILLEAKNNSAMDGANESKILLTRIERKLPSTLGARTTIDPQDATCVENALLELILVRLVDYMTDSTKWDKTKINTIKAAFLELIDLKSITIDNMERILKKAAVVFANDAKSTGGLMLKQLLTTLEATRVPQATPSEKLELYDLSPIRKIQDLQSLEALQTYFHEVNKDIFSTDGSAHYLVALLCQAIKLHFNEKYAGSLGGNAGDMLGLGSPERKRRTAIRNHFPGTSFIGSNIAFIGNICFKAATNKEEKIEIFEDFCNEIDEKTEATKLSNIISSIILAYRAQTAINSHASIISAKIEFDAVTDEAKDMSRTASAAAAKCTEALGNIGTAENTARKANDEASELLAAVEQDSQALLEEVKAIEASKKELDKIKSAVRDLEKQYKEAPITQKLNAIASLSPASLVAYIKTMESNIAALESTFESERSHAQSDIGIAGSIASMRSEVKGLLTFIDALDTDSKELLSTISTRITALYTNAGLSIEGVSSSASTLIQANEDIETQFQTIQKTNIKLNTELTEVKAQYTAIIQQYQVSSKNLQTTKEAITQSQKASQELADTAATFIATALSKVEGISLFTSPIQVLVDSLITNLPEYSQLSVCIPDDLAYGYVFTQHGLYYVDKQKKIYENLFVKDGMLANLRQVLKPTVVAQDLSEEVLEKIIAATGHKNPHKSALDEALSFFKNSTQRSTLYKSINAAKSFSELKAIMNDSSNFESIKTDRSCTLLALLLAKLIMHDYNESNNTAKIALYQHYFPNLVVNDAGIVSFNIQSRNGSFFYTLAIFKQLILDLNPGFTPGEAASSLVKLMSNLLKGKMADDTKVMSKMAGWIGGKGVELKTLADNNSRKAADAHTLAQQSKSTLGESTQPVEQLQQTVNRIAGNTSKLSNTLKVVQLSQVSHRKEVAHVSKKMTEARAVADARQKEINADLVAMTTMTAALETIAAPVVNNIITNSGKLIQRIHVTLTDHEQTHSAERRRSLEDTLQSLTAQLTRPELDILLNETQRDTIRRQVEAEVEALTKLYVSSATLTTRLAQTQRQQSESIQGAVKRAGQKKKLADNMLSTTSGLVEQHQNLVALVHGILLLTEKNEEKAKTISQDCDRLIQSYRGLTRSNSSSWKDEIKYEMNRYAAAWLTELRNDKTLSLMGDSKSVEDALNKKLIELLRQFVDQLITRYREDKTYRGISTQKKIDKFELALKLPEEKNDKVPHLDINKVIDNLASACQRRRNSSLLFLGETRWIDTDSTEIMKGTLKVPIGVNKVESKGLLEIIDQAQKELPKLNKVSATASRPK